MLFDRTCLLSVTRTCREGENERGERERQRGRERLGERGRETEKVFDRTCLLHASAWSVSGLSLSDGGGKRETEREVDRHSRNLNTRHERDCECKVLSSESWCGRERLWERAASAMADEWRDVHRSYGRRIQSKIVKRCPGGIDSMPTAEQAMMRMLQVRCAIVCVSVCGWQSACAARALLCVCRSACLCGLRAVLCIGGCCPTVLSYCVVLLCVLPSLPSHHKAHEVAHFHTCMPFGTGLWGRQCGVANCARNDGARHSAGDRC